MAWLSHSFNLVIWNWGGTGAFVIFFFLFFKSGLHWKKVGEAQDDSSSYAGTVMLCQLSGLHFLGGWGSG